MKYKYPHTYHVPWSKNLKNDDRMHPNMSMFNDEVVIVTEKMDGENTTMYNDYIHARSIDSKNSNHASRDMVKSIWGNIKYAISDEFRICGENIYAQHSIIYDDLESYFLVFSTWVDDYCQSWEETYDTLSHIKTSTGIELKTVPLLYYGFYDKEIIHNKWLEYSKTLNRESEGYVIRPNKGFFYNQDIADTKGFFIEVAKYVRKNHVQTDEHWLENWDPTKINKLKSKK